MCKRFLPDDCGAMLADYALIMAVTFACIGCLALYLGNDATAAVRRVAEIISGEVVEVARQARPN